MFKKEQLTLGIDIGSSNIKLVQLKRVGGGYELLKFEMVPVKDGVIVDGAIMDKSSITNSLAELLKKANINKGQACIGLSGQSSLIIKRVTLPYMTDKELSLSIKFEAQQFIPFDLSAVSIDYYILDKTPKPDNTMDVILVAVNNDLLNDYLEILGNVGLEVVVVDAKQFALSNMFELNYGLVDQKNIAIADIGANSITLNIVQKGTPIFWRESVIGSTYHTEVIENAFNIPREDAERLKKGMAIEGISPEEAESIINKASDELYADIYRSLEVFKSNFYNETVEKIAICGGASLIKNFATDMAHRIDIEVEVIDPFRKIHIPDKLNPSYLKEIAPLAAVAVGLAIRRPGDR
ncbi:MAG: pilus assembly protein PilM [Thermodesulfovibrionales bacterium]|nr:pilus assembly protein PilM [Thermodesulfovibrionales bacterium]